MRSINVIDDRELQAKMKLKLGQGMKHATIEVKEFIEETKYRDSRLPKRLDPVYT